MEQVGLRDGEIALRNDVHNRCRPHAWLWGLCWALLLLATIFMGAGDLFAQENLPPRTQQAAVEFQIPPQPLGSALNAFAEATGWQVSVPTELIADRTSPGVSGSRRPEEALQALLAGTGVTYRLTDTNAVMLVPGAVSSSMEEHLRTAPEPRSEPTEVAESKPVKVPEIVVKDMKTRGQGYTAEDASTAMRIPVPIHDIPRSVEVITRQVMEDQKVIRMNDALRNVSGTFESQSQGGRGGEFMIRGFASSLNVFKNGFRDDSTFGSRSSRDVINLESIEVIKGPPSYLYGRSDPGGLINQITKAPLKSPYYSAEMIFGNYSLYRPQIDIGGPLNESKTLTYRFNGMYESAESFREGVKTDRIFLAPTIGWEIGPRTTFRFEGEYLYDKSPIDRGIVALGSGPAPIPIGRFLGDPTRRREAHAGKATLILLHELNAQLRFRSAFRAAVTRENYSSLEGWELTPSTGVLTLARFELPSTNQSHYWQNELLGSFTTWSIKHKSILGVELGREVQSQQFRGDFAGLGSFINIFNPADRSFADGPLAFAGNFLSTNSILGAYAGDQIDLLPNLHVHLGGRYDVIEQKERSRPDDFDPTTRGTNSTETAFSPSIGAAYQPWPWVSIFANYTESFTPQFAGARSFTGDIFRPERGKAVEGGLKFQAAGGRLRSTLAAFNITKRNVLTTDPVNGPAFSITAGEQRSRGFEFDLNGEIWPGWNVIATYAYTDAKVTEDNVFTIGSRLPNVPLHQGSLWTTYFIQEGLGKGFGVGIGMYAQGRRQGINTCQNPADCGTPFDMPGFVRMDAAVYYRKPELFHRTNLLAAINFTNLLDQRYFTGSQFSGLALYPGAPLTVIGSVKLEFN
jgi:iron complex outermembrane recepter protein